MLESLDASTAKTFVSGFVGETSVMDGFVSAMSGTPTTPKGETSAVEKPTAEEMQKAAPTEASAEEAEGKAAGATEPAVAVEKAAAEKAKIDAPAVSITADDITKVIVGKIKQNRSNSDKIGSLLKTYGAAKVSELPASKYEAFLTDISQL